MSSPVNLSRFLQELLESTRIISIELRYAIAENSSSRRQKILDTIIESLSTSTTLVEDSNSNREEIDIFSGPDDSIPPGIESDFDIERGIK
ncbi:hypothetical protein Tco_1220047 [Tanacetum coccineum]